MALALITGSCGLVGSESARLFHEKGLSILGLDNDLRARFFGKQASTAWNRRRLERELKRYRHFGLDIRSRQGVERLVKRFGRDIRVIIHAAAQPSHDWAARDPRTDFAVNAEGTLNLLEAARRFCPEAPFIFTSTNKVYGDAPNRLPLRERETRWELEAPHPYAKHGIDESMSVDNCLHSLFGVSKTSADLLAQEYGRYFGLRTCSFRCGCLTGPAHSGAELHGFLAYLMQCAVTGAPYSVFGYKGKQVRDNLHSRDLAEAFYRFFLKPRAGEVYNMGGSRFSHCSMLEAVALCEEIAGKPMRWTYVDRSRIGDHIWWVSDVRKFQAHYPGWKVRRGIRSILEEIRSANVRGGKWRPKES